MRKTYAGVLVLFLLAAACGDDGAADPDEAQTCEDLVDIAIEVLQDAFDAAADVTPNAFAEMVDGNAEAPPELERMWSMDQEFEARADELGCTDEQTQQLMCDRIDRLRADNPVGEIIFNSISAGC